MKHVRSNGLMAEVRDIGPVLYRINGPGTPVAVNKVMSDDEARQFLQGLKDKGFKGEKLEQ